MALATVPVAVNPFAASRFDTEKGLLLRGWGLMAAVLLVIRWGGAWWNRRRQKAGREGGRDGCFPENEPVVGWLLIALAAWVSIHVFSSFFALSPGLAWHGGASRGGGIWTLLACVSLFASVVLECRQRVQMERLLLAMVVGSVGPTVVGLLQVAGSRLFIGSSGLPENRPWSTFGNAIAFGSYLVGAMPATCYWVWRLRRWPRALPTVLLVSQSLLLYRTASRGPMIGLGIALGFSLLLLLRQRGHRNAALAASVAIITLMAVFLGGIQLVARSEIVRQSTRTGMLTRYNTVEVRVLFYEAMTRRMANRAPLAAPDGPVDRWARWRFWIGYGPECLSEPLMSQLPARIEFVEEEGRVPDSTHSLWMDVLGGAGAIGLGVHLLLSVMLLRVVRRVLGFQLEHRHRRLAGLSLFGCTLCGMSFVVLLWGMFAWALGLLFGASLGILTAMGVALHAERGRGDAHRQALASDRAPNTSAPEVGIAAAGSLTALWVEAHFGIPLATSSLLFFMVAGLLVAILRQTQTAAAAAELVPGEISPFGGWLAVAALSSGLLLVCSSMDNVLGMTDWTRVLRFGLARQSIWVVAVVSVALAWVGSGTTGRKRVLLPALVLSSLFLAVHASELAQLRTAPLRSVGEIVGWSRRMQSAAAFRLVPLAFVPALLVLPCWKIAARGAAAGLFALALAGACFWSGIRSDILLATAQYTADLGEPGAALQVFEAAVPSLDRAPHAAHLASQVRILAARAARAVSQEEDSEPAWDRAIHWAEQAVLHRPLLASHRGELAGVLETASRESDNPSRARVLAKKADEAYAAAVTLAPGLNVYRRRQAGMRFTLRKDYAGSYWLLRQMLLIDPEEPVALTMLSKQSLLSGQAAAEEAEQIRHFTAAIHYGERALRSRTQTVVRMDLRGTQADLKALRDWFSSRNLRVPSWPAPQSAAKPYLPPRIPEVADLDTLWRLAQSGLSALILALILTPLFRRLAFAAGFVDAPAARKLHLEPTPLLGGGAILFAVWAGFLFEAPRGLPAPYPAMLAVATGLALVGLVDDRRPVSWRIKLLAQGIAAVALWSAGVRVRLAWLPPWANLTLTLSWLVGITNAVNFLDNMNGLSAGLSLLAAAGVAALGVLNEGWDVAIVAVSMVGACLGFLRYNHHWRATIFMGDTGSLFLGSLLASLALQLRFPANHNWVTWLCPVLLLAVPVFDMTHVCLARLRRGVNPFSTPGKDHTSHLLARMGLRPHGAVLAIHAAVVLCALAAGVVAYASPIVAYGVAGLVFAAAVFLLLYLELRFGRGGTEE